MNDAPMQRIAGHVIALDLPDVPPCFFISSIALDPPVASVAGFDEAPAGHNTRLATVQECLALAFMALDQATVRDPGVLERDNPEIADLLILLRPAVQRLLMGLAQSDNPNALTRLIDREAEWRTEERLIPLRDAARERAAREVMHLLRTLVAIAAEPDVTARATALAALAPEAQAGDGGVTALCSVLPPASSS